MRRAVTVVRHNRLNLDRLACHGDIRKFVVDGQLGHRFYGYRLSLSSKGVIPSGEIVIDSCRYRVILTGSSGPPRVAVRYQLPGDFYRTGHTAPVNRGNSALLGHHHEKKPAGIVTVFIFYADFCLKVVERRNRRLYAEFCVERLPLQRHLLIYLNLHRAVFVEGWDDATYPITPWCYI